jgi:hypothetical protein
LQKYSDKIPNVSIEKLGADLKSKVISGGSKLFGRG